MKQLRLIILLIFFSIFSYGQNENKNFSHDGVLEKVFDNYGTALKLKDVAITPKKSIVDGSTILTSNLLVTAGIFEIYFEDGSGMELNNATHNARRAVVSQVFTNLSNFLNTPLKNSGNTTKVKIWIRNFDEIAEIVPEQYTYGTSYYNVFKNLTTASITDNQLWKVINGGKNPYENVSNRYYNGASLQFYHATFSFNFTKDWNSDLLDKAEGGEFDLYTHVLREVVHALGFNSLLNKDGLSKFGPDYKYYSRFDKYLVNQNDTNLIASANGLTSQINYDFNGSGSDLDNCGSSVENTCATTNKFRRTFDIMLHTPQCYSSRETLQYVADQCNESMADYWLMKYTMAEGETQRFMNEYERQILIDLGYGFGDSFGDLQHFSSYDYDLPEAVTAIVGYNDGIAASSYVFTGNVGDTIVISNLISNDSFTNLNFENLVDLTDSSTQFSATSGTSATNIQAVFDSPGMHLLSYVPYNSTTDVRGNIAYVYVNARLFCGALEPEPCNYVTNGDFDDNIGSPSGGNSLNDFACNWYDDNNSSLDYYLNGANPPLGNLNNLGSTTPIPVNGLIAGSTNAYAGFATGRGLIDPNNPRDFEYFSEIGYANLNISLLPNTTYRLSFHVLKGNNPGDMDGSPEIQACLIQSAGNPVMQYTTPENNYVVPTGSIFLDQDEIIDNTGAWEPVEFIFTTDNTAGQNFLVIGPLVDPDFAQAPTATQTSYYTSYCYFDNVELTPVFNPVFNTPNNICLNEAGFDLNELLTGETEGGFFAINGTEITGTIFDPATVGEGTYTITYTIPDTIACNEIVVSSTITVASCLPTSQPYISQTYVYGSSRFIEVKNADDTISIAPGMYYLAIYPNGVSPIGNAPTDFIDLSTIAAQDAKVFRTQLASSPGYALSNPVWVGLNNFDGNNDILIITTTTDTSAYDNRIDMVGDYTNWGGKRSLVRISCTPMGFPRTDAFDERDWVEFSSAEVGVQGNTKNSDLGRHFSETMTWDGSVWDDFGNSSFPDRSRYEIINGPYNTSTASTGSFEACGILVNAPLTLSASMYAKIQIHVDVVAPGVLTVENNGSLVMVRDCYYNNVCGTDLINLNSATGMSLTRQTVNLTGPYDYVYWSSPLSTLSTNPVAGQIFNFGSGTGPVFDKGRFYSFENQNYCDIYRKYNVAQPLETDGYDDNLNDYLPFTHASNANAENQHLIPGRGYNTWPPAPVTPGNYNYTIEFEGEMNNGIVTVPLFKNNSEKGKNSNLVGNPYPSAIDLNILFSANSEIIEPIAYIWSRISDDPNQGIPGPQGYNYTAANFTVYTNDFNLNDQNNSDFAGDNIISSGQSFFVRPFKNFDGFTNDSVAPLTVPVNINPATHPYEQIISAGNLVFNNSMRTTEPNDTFSRYAGQNQRVSKNLENATTDKLWVSLTDANNFTVQLGVGFKATASAAYVPGEDFSTISGRKYNFFTQSTPEDLMIDIQDAFTIDKVIPLGITNINSEENQLFTISIPKKVGVFESQEVYVYDSLLNTYHNLSNSGYTFTSLNNVIEGRFSLCFTNNNSNLAKHFEANQVDVISKNDKVVVKSIGKNIQAVYVFDIYTPNGNGMEVAKNEGLHDTEHSIIVSEKYKLLNVKIILEDGSVISKKILR